MALVALVVVLLLAVAWLVSGFVGSGGGASSQAASSAPASGEGQSAPGSSSAEAGQTEYQPAALPEEMRAMYISYLEWMAYDISTETAMRSVATQMFDNCSAMGLNTVIVMVRPFGDALYNSSLYPWSHLITGTQGQNPGYDPLAVLVEEAHARGLRLEAWLNPYRINSESVGPQTLAASNPAVLHPEWVREAAGGQWYDPGLPEVRQLVVDGVAEIVQNYDVDGIHFDDYFYPVTDASFDAETYAAYGGGQPLADWRRGNVNTLVQQVYSAIKAAKPTLPFGISPQGNNENNYNSQYSDVKLWLQQAGYVDYVMPQLYWGFDWSKNGSTRYGFANIAAEWAAYPKIEAVKLYAALGAYRIGGSDGGDNDQSEWSSGENLAKQVAHLRQVQGFSGFCFFRYEFLYNGSELAGQEQTALAGLLQ